VSLTRRGKIVIGIVAVVAAVLVGLGILAFTADVPVLRDIVGAVTGRPSPCPLTGQVRSGDKDAPSRPMFAVKVENTAEAFPLAGLEAADVIYEEPVEGGITRFVALFQCRDSRRVGPVRSARTTDPKILVQYADAPLLAYSGAATQVTAALESAGIASFTETSGGSAFTRDDARAAPHNLFVSTRALFSSAKKAGDAFSPPAEVFTFDDEVPQPSRRARTATVTFSTATTAEWVWTRDRWIRHLGGTPMLLESGDPIAATNVVVQEVVVTESNIVDASGARSPEVDLTGRGRAWIFRDGRMVLGRWVRASLDDVTVFETKAGERIALAPGTTFVQLIPKEDGEVVVAR
jgi:hypothetical protein